MANLTSKNIVVLNNDHIGIVVEFNGKPSYIMTAAYCRNLDSYDENLKCKNDKYSVKEIYDGSQIESANDVFKKTFTTENLPKIEF